MTTSRRLWVIAAVLSSLIVAEWLVVVSGAMKGWREGCNLNIACRDTLK